MKSNHLVAVGAFLLCGIATASAQITPVGTILSSQMPGSSTDFTFAGTSASYSGLPYYGADAAPGTTDLTDFTVAPGSSAQGMYSVASNQAGGYATVSAPAGYAGSVSAPATVQTAVAFSANTGNNAPDLLTFTLGSTPSYNYSDFYVLIMFGNYGVTNQGASLDLTVLDPSGDFSLVSPIADDSASNSAANFAEFEIKGATAGDQLEIGATPYSNANPVLGGVSFSQTEVEVPEPSTWALFGLGAGFLLWRLRRRGLTI